MKHTKEESSIINRIARAYVGDYVRNLIFSQGEIKKPLSDFLGEHRDGDFEELVELYEIEPEFLIKDAKLEDHQQINLTEALEISFRDLEHKINEKDKRLKNAELLRKSYSEIIKDPHLNEYEKFMFIALMETKDVNVDDVQTIEDTLTPYMGSFTHEKKGFPLETINVLDLAVIRKYPILLGALVRSRFDNLLHEKGYHFKTQDDRLEYFIQRSEDAKKLRKKFKRGQTMYEVYTRVAQLFDNVGSLVIPGAKQRIRDPDIKVEDLNDIVESIDHDREYDQSEVVALIGRAWDDDSVRNQLVRKRKKGKIIGQDVYMALTVEFPATHQLTGIQTIIEKKRVVIADKMGTGKTAQGILSVPAVAYERKMQVNALVTCPYSMLSEWSQRVNEYLETDSKHRSTKTIWSWDDLKELVSDYEKSKKLPSFVIINYEKLMRSKWTGDDVHEFLDNEEHDEEFEELVREKIRYVHNNEMDLENINTLASEKTGLEINAPTVKDAIHYWVATEQVNLSKKMSVQLKNLGFNMLICDESDLARNVEALRTKEIIDLGKSCEYYIELTGTLAPHSIEDVAKTLHLLQGKYINGEFMSDYSFENFKERFKQKPRLLHTILSPRLLRRTLKDTANLKNIDLKKRRVNISFDKYPKQREAYLAIVQDEDLEVLSKLDLLHKVSLDPQLAKDYYTGQPGASAKYDRLFDMLENDRKAKRQSVIYTVLKDGVTRRGKHDPEGRILIDHLQERFGSRVGMIDGHVKGPERKELIQRYNVGDLDIMLLTAKAMGRGVDLSAGQRIYHLNKTYLPDDEDQQNARLFRRGQKNNVLAYSLLINDPELTATSDLAGSLDQGIEALHKKRRLFSELLLAGGKGWSKEKLDILLSNTPHLEGYM